MRSILPAHLPLIVADPPELSRGERRFSFWFACMTGITVLLPYLRGVLLHPQSLFLGTPLQAIADHRSYLTWIGQAMEGQVMFFHPAVSTVIGVQGGFFHPVFFTIGKIGAMFEVNAATLFSVFSAIVAALAVFAAYRFFTYLTPVVRTRVIATILFVTASGVGAAMLPAPNPYLYPEFSMFVRMHQYVLGSIDTLITFAVLILAATDLRIGRRKDAMVLGGLLGMLALVHPYMVVILTGVVGLFGVVLLVRDRDPRVALQWLRALAVLLPFILWQALALANDAAFAWWFFSGMDTAAYPLSMVVLGYGLLLPLGLFGIFVFLTTPTSRDVTHRSILLLVALWAVVMVLGVIQPWMLSIARRFGEQLFIPLSFLAAIALSWVWGARPKWIPVAVLLIILMGFGTVRAWSRLWVDAGLPLGSAARAPMDVIDRDTLQMFTWMRSRVGPDQVVLSGGATSSVLPIFVPTRVVFGHPALVIDIHSVEWTFRDALAQAETCGRSWRQMLTSVDWILVDRELRAMGYDPKQDPCVTRVQTFGDMVLYRVTLDRCVISR